MFNQMQLDILKEIGNIGAGNASTALSQLLNKKIEMNVPMVRILSFDEMMELYGSADKKVASIFLQFSGDLTGNMFFVLSVEKASTFIQQLPGLDQCSFVLPPYSEMAISAFQELGNIVASSYLTALSEFLRLSIIPSVPAVSIDMFGAIITYGLIEISKVSDHAIVIDAEIKDPFSKDKNGFIKGHFLLLPDPDSFQKIFSSLGVNQ
ncbi:chemotaxis protein CheC [Fervidibacillus halotolerans]|uniref:Chemotaxis protein CheC n=1 Tax=Fervidibacillus halotolerans TaxID=2980027 RepID=A0A9E8M1X6_9BACI|nr:chemotaxis protein CheC [Fervidibacillus halotolerans]WAA13902.1 chemotaxis protein CheC [Fervidibacillus halotolerans]